LHSALSIYSLFIDKIHQCTPILGPQCANMLCHHCLHLLRSAFCPYSYRVVAVCRTILRFLSSCFSRQAAYFG
jgi:hypothetical protein